jgi:hypothetical protein
MMTFLRRVLAYPILGLSLLLVAGTGCGATETNVSAPESEIDTGASRGDCAADEQPCESDGGTAEVTCNEDADCAEGERCGAKGLCSPKRER